MPLAWCQSGRWRKTTKTHSHTPKALGQDACHWLPATEASTSERKRLRWMRPSMPQTGLSSCFAWPQRRHLGLQHLFLLPDAGHDFSSLPRDATRSAIDPPGHGRNRCFSSTLSAHPLNGPPVASAVA